MNKTEQEICKIINDYEKDNPSICGTDTLIAFIKWYELHHVKPLLENHNREILDTLKLRYPLEFAKPYPKEKTEDDY